MDAHRIAIKLFLTDPNVNLHDVVPVFHSWIQNQALSGNLLIDVADYLHVPTGPGIVLVAHEANFATDQAEGRTGLFYQRKRPVTGDPLLTAFRDILTAAWLLETDTKLGGKWKFDTREIRVRIADKLQAPNEDASLAKVKPALDTVLKKLFGAAEYRIEKVANDPLASFEVKILSATNLPVETLLARLQD